MAPTVWCPLAAQAHHIPAGRLQDHGATTACPNGFLWHCMHLRKLVVVIGTNAHETRPLSVALCMHGASTGRQPPNASLHAATSIDGPGQMHGMARCTARGGPGRLQRYGAASAQGGVRLRWLCNIHLQAMGKAISGRNCTSMPPHRLVPSGAGQRALIDTDYISHYVHLHGDGKCHLHRNTCNTASGWYPLSGCCKRRLPVCVAPPARHMHVYKPRRALWRHPRGGGRGGGIAAGACWLPRVPRRYQPVAALLHAV